jgi:DNA-binding transcriptional MerR regulator
MRSGQLARLARVSTDTLRYYERRGLLPRPTRGANNYRDYRPDALERVLLVRRALALSFSVAEMAQLLAVRNRGGAPCRAARELLARKLDGLEVRLRELRQLRRSLRDTLADWDARLLRTPPGSRARLLEAIPQRRRAR